LKALIAEKGALQDDLDKKETQLLELVVSNKSSELTSSYEEQLLEANKSIDELKEQVDSWKTEKVCKSFIYNQLLSGQSPT
jgi:hypothetical protein